MAEITFLDGIQAELNVPELSNAPGLLNVFQANRAEIEAIARRLIQIHRYEPDGSIIIRGTDV
jgi:hypothetical protein